MSDVVSLRPARGNLPSGWSWRSVGSLAAEQRLRAGASQGLPVLSVTKHQGIIRADDYHKRTVHGRDTTNYKVVRRGQFAYATIHLDEGSIGFIDDGPDGIVSPMYTVFEPRGDIDNRYLFLLLKSPSALRAYSRMAEGTVNRRASIGFDSLCNLYLLLPPLPEQRKIAAILSAVDEVIEKTEAVIESLQALKKAMMQELLTRGLPGRHARFKQTEIGEVPEEWEVETIGDLVSFSGGSQPPKAEFVSDPQPGYVRLIQIRDYKTDRFRVYVREASVRKFCGADDVMIGRYGPPIFQILRGIAGAYNVALIKATPDEAKLSKTYLYYFLQLEDLFSLIDRLSQRTSGQTGVDLDALREYPLPLPPLDMQGKIVATLDDTQARIDAETALLAIQRQCKSALMSVLLTGELRVTPDQDAA